MERVIDRKEYRRNNEESKIDEDVRVEILKNKIRGILFQSLGASAILLIVSFLKFYNCTDILHKINNALDSKISVSSLQKSGQIIYSEATKYYTKLNEVVDRFFNDEGVVITMFDGNKIVEESGENVRRVENNEISSTNIFDSGSNFISAVEGINQMSEDAKYINDNYELTVPVIGTITSEFGVRNSSNPKVSSYHSGLDIAANTGTEILAALDGEVIEATTDTYYGKYLKIKKDDITMIYAHCSKLLVKVGDKVKRGNLIAYVGNTGNSTGSHLHFELKYKDRLVNPIDVMDVK